MKNNFIAVLLLFLCLNLSAAFAQSSRSVQAEENKKANKRPAATPTPKAETTENSQTEEIIPEDSIIDDTDVIEVATEIVTFPVKVLDRKGRFVPGLQKENFKVFEDKTEQEIAFFNNEQQPFTVALVLDMSYSATFKIDEIQAAAIAFIDQLRKDDKIMVVSFNEEVIVLTEPTSDRQKIYSAIRQTRVGSGTSLYEAVDFVVNQRLKKINGRKAIVLFTDGVDTTSQTRPRSFKSARCRRNRRARLPDSLRHFRRRSANEKPDGDRSADSAESDSFVNSESVSVSDSDRRHRHAGQSGNKRGRLSQSGGIFKRYGKPHGRANL